MINIEGRNAHFFPTRDDPESFSSTSKQSKTFSVFPPEDSLDFTFVFLGTSTEPLLTASLGFSLGSADRRDSATI